LFDLSAAVADRAAAVAISLPGGPGAPPSRPQRGWRRGGKAKAPAQVPFGTISVKGIAPLVQLGTLEAVLTGRDYEQTRLLPPLGQPHRVRAARPRLTLTAR